MKGVVNINVSVLLWLLIATFISNLIYEILNHKISLIPIQVFIGIIIATLFFNEIDINPEVFMIMVIVPLLFNEGQNKVVFTSHKELINNFKIGFFLSLVLAIANIIIVSILVKYIFESHSALLGIILASVLIPTDLNAVNLLSNGRIIPEKVKYYLEKDSFFNDDIGLILFSISATSYVLGKFKILNSMFEFSKILFGGLILGIILGSLVVYIRVKLKHNFAPENSILVPYNLITPFIIYLFAEHIGVSGLIAVVTAGNVQAYEKNFIQLNSSRLQIVTKSIWDIISNFLNGIIFIILGLYIYKIFNELKNTRIDIIKYTFIALLIYMIIISIRYFLIRYITKKYHSVKISDSDSRLFAVSGIHGSITIAILFLVPEVMKGISYIDQLELMYVIILVVIFSIIVPFIYYKFLPKSIKPFTNDDLTKYRDKMIDYTLSNLDKLEATEQELRSLYLLIESQKDLYVNHHIEFNEDFYKILVQIKEIENNEVFTYIGKYNVSERLINFYIGVQNKFYENISKSKVIERKLLKEAIKGSRSLGVNKGYYFSKEDSRILAKLDMIAYTVVKNYLDKLQNFGKTDNNILSYLISMYSIKHSIFQKDAMMISEENIKVENRLIVGAFRFQYFFVQKCLSSKEISSELARELYIIISNAELVLLQDEDYK